MAMNGNPPLNTNDIERRLGEGYRELSRRILMLAIQEAPRVEFLRVFLENIAEFSSCDYIELRVRSGHRIRRCAIEGSQGTSYCFRAKPIVTVQEENGFAFIMGDTDFEKLCGDVMSGRYDPDLKYFTDRGSFWAPEISNPNLKKNSAFKYSLNSENGFESIALVPIRVGEENVGLLIMKSREKFFFTEQEISLFEEAGETLGIALIIQRAQAERKERIKELTCLYGISQTVEDPTLGIDKILNGIAELIPPGWQYPDITSAIIELDGQEFTTEEFNPGHLSMRADINVMGDQRGFVEVFYSQGKIENEESPFLDEEYRLLDMIAAEIGNIVERREAREERKKLEEQLRHADRLATLGQLASGVAHELNEPLANILGFVQLILNNQNLAEETSGDLRKIEKASLHAREVIRKLLFFGRQMPTKKSEIDINKIVSDGLYFLESRCAKEGIELIKKLAPDLPKIYSDQAQIHQVIVNLIVNAIQAMPEGGILTIRTELRDDYVIIEVADTGKGIPEDIRKKIFLPFFTTKEVGDGTGLGLSVVHGIVTSQGGRIEVDSEMNKGSRFIISLPINQVNTNGKE